MKSVSKTGIPLLVLIAGLSMVGCTVEEKPDVVTTPGSPTIIHEKSTPNVVVTPPAGHTDTHTETHTTIPDTGTTSTTTTTTTGH